MLGQRQMSALQALVIAVLFGKFEEERPKGKMQNRMQPEYSCGRESSRLNRSSGTSSLASHGIMEIGHGGDHAEVYPFARFLTRASNS